jgi:shikimate 5-dehydrogenase
MNAALMLALPLCACSGIDSVLDAVSASSGTSPIIKASNSGSARMTLIMCPRSESNVEAARELLQQMIATGSELVVARSGGNAALTINACPSGMPIPAPPPVPTSSTRRN